MSPELHSLLLAALLLFSLRILDVTLGTLRITYLVRGRRSVAGLLGFFEALVWLTAAAQVLGSLDSPVKFVAYAAGYAAGTMLGVSVERWIAVGDSLLRVVSKVDAPPLSWNNAWTWSSDASTRPIPASPRHWPPLPRHPRGG